MPLAKPLSNTDYVHTDPDKIIYELTIALKTDLNACDLKWTLFVAAAQSYRYDSQLRPFPPFYQDGASVNIAALMAVIVDIPPLSSILGLLYGMQGDKQGEIFLKHERTLRLLHWILVTVSEPCLKSVDSGQVSSEIHIS